MTVLFFTSFSMIRAVKLLVVALSMFFLETTHALGVGTGVLASFKALGNFLTTHASLL
jgi:hypothetical protein